MNEVSIVSTISNEQADRLYWLGRYVERVSSTLKLFNRSIDRMLDQDDDDYVDFCRRLSIPSNIYSGLDDFQVRYLFDPENPDSVYSNLSRAYDNAIVLRNFITSESLAYVQLALNHLEKGAIAESAFLETLRVSDWLLAFWGSIDDNVADLERRDLLKVGKYAERLDMRIRLDFGVEEIEPLLPRLLAHTKRVAVLLNREAIAALANLKVEEIASDPEGALKIVNALH
ncbi:MAG: alpha-E domain-containing protein [Duodenibacillus sp.]